MDIISGTVERKIELNMTSRGVRQWRNEIKSSYSELLKDRAKIVEVLRVREEEIKRDQEAEAMEAEKRQQERVERQHHEARARQEEFDERLRQEKLETERQLLEEKLRYEIRVTEKRIEMETKTKSTQAKLPKLRISPFNGTPIDWIRFENMFTTQVHEKPTSDEEKFRYLLEMVNQKVRERISNLKPSTSGYNTAWERLKRDYGHTTLVVNAHMDVIVSLQVVKGSSYEKVKEFYEKASQSFDALQTLGQADMLKGFVLSTLNKLPNIKSDLVRTDNEWESWSMKDLLDNLQQWLKRNKMTAELSHLTTLKGRDSGGHRKVRRNRKTENACSVRRIIGLTPVLAKIQRRKGKHSLLHAGFVSTVGLQVTEQMNVRVEDAAHVKEDIQVYVIERRKIWY